MSKIDKLLTRFYSKPKDFTWSEAIKVLNYFGFEEMKKGKTGGSRRKFVNGNKDVISLHEPHPGNILKGYQIDLIIQQINPDYEELF
ncbi:putative RNA binding protein YcfA (HicA-like mRNA interferase family) [Pedobacter sp. AK017]|uniref:type II toxin-antitoxin system HicA family toxin n=1 Tax=Pedobacter sp. AK017 TaxID=2723073 RepID=UPI0016219EED|nr:type II toxin-antitoxin system HicA family toxin [Pedobacter sp. AK017]MBB5439397.1 putative RNA binding protein YcfA (HicA-like mRNA interferase family) [Pedobacter sp. AK017]